MKESKPKLNLRDFACRTTHSYVRDRANDARIVANTKAIKETGCSYLEAPFGGMWWDCFLADFDRVTTIEPMMTVLRHWFDCGEEGEVIV